MYPREMTNYCPCYATGAVEYKGVVVGARTRLRPPSTKGQAASAACMLDAKRVSSCPRRKGALPCVDRMPSIISVFCREWLRSGMYLSIRC